MMEPAEDRSRDNPRANRETLASDRGCEKLGRWVGKAGAKARVRAAATLMLGPTSQKPPQALFPEPD